MPSLHGSIKYVLRYRNLGFKREVQVKDKNFDKEYIDHDEH